MATLLKKFFTHMGRRGEVGQSIILLAIGFIALAGFVGITVDVSIMFVRYAQLSRAVDSAAIAAANQMRQDKTLATVGLAARQFIEFHGLNPESVWVDTCLTQPGDPELCTSDQAKLVRVRAFVKVPTVFMKLLGIQSFDLVAAAVSQTAALDVVLIMDVSESMASDTTYQDWARVEKIGATADKNTWTTTNYGVIYRPPQSYDVLKAYGLSDTNTLYNLQTWWEGGDGTVTGTAGAKVTLKDSVTGAPLTVSAPYSNPVSGLLMSPQINVNNRFRYVDVNGGADGPVTCCTRETAYTVKFNNQFFNDTNFPGQGYGNTVATHPREECRVRFYPSANTVSYKRYYGYNKPDGTQVDLATLYTTGGTPNSKMGYTATQPTAPTFFDGFVPTYLYYKCCNDPDGDGLFADITCQPFKQARDATLEFLQRIDFVRGDRAAFVTFDRTAYLVNPYGYPNAGSVGDESTRPGAMLDNWTAAFETLKSMIGVRAEPSFYVYKPGTGGGLTSGWDPAVMSAGIQDDGTSIPINYASTAYDPQADNPLSYNYPVFDNCPFANAAQQTDRSLFDNSMQNIGLPNELGIPGGTPGGAFTEGYNNDGRATAWGTYKDVNAKLIEDATQVGKPAGQRSSYNIVMSYEYWASCRSGNVGAALREGNNALLNPRTVRRFGTVWVMVMLSDGAAGASDPMRRNGLKIPQPKPYEKVSAAGVVPAVYGKPGNYGSLGACPYGTPTVPGELVLIANDTTGGLSARFPFCSDEDPSSRHTCDFRPLRTLANYKNSQAQKKTALQDKGYDVTKPTAGSSPEAIEIWNRAHGNMYDVDIDTDSGDGYGGCDALYDVDDYAHDWADFIGLQDLAGSGTAQLPTIFTIGFGLGYTVTTNTSGTEIRTNATLPLNAQVNQAAAQASAVVLCGRNPANCQGEQMLRYIADIGDNNAIDNDFWQDAMQEYYNFDTGTPGMGLVLNGNMAPPGQPVESFDRRDPCQTEDGPVNGSYDTNNNGITDLGAERDREYGMLGPNRSCGNYYYAPDGNELQFVFDDIASRMFTRLSR